MQSILERLVEIRNLRGLRQKDVAELMGIGQPALSELESGNTAPKLDTIQRYAKALGYDVEWTLRSFVERIDNGNEGS